MSRILLAETQTDLASAIYDYFSLKHYSVQVENNGLNVLNCLRQNRFDVILLEIALPGIDGIGVVRGYRAAGGSTPILLMSVKHSSEELQSGLDAGAEAYVV
ncbi:MAG: response regulator, partial [Cyanobacteria bacterium]|nr:response regulator [Cyanobacteriota bacterium]